MLPQIMPISWLFIFFMLIFIFFSLYMYLSYFYFSFLSKKSLMSKYLLSIPW